MSETINNVTVLPNDKIEILSFAVPLDQAATMADRAVVVGTITCLSQSSAMVWFGWGELDHSQAPSKHTTVGTGVPPVMGPMVVAMPQQSYRGAFPNSVASSQLLSSSGEQEDDAMLATQASSRLTKRLGKPVFVSCCLNNHGAATTTTLQQEPGMQLDDPSTMAQHAAALAEREVTKILKERWS